MRLTIYIRLENVYTFRMESTVSTSLVVIFFYYFGKEVFTSYIMRTTFLCSLRANTIQASLPYKKTEES